MMIHTKDCKKAIAAYLKESPNVAYNQFDCWGLSLEAFIKPAIIPKNWFRYGKFVVSHSEHSVYQKGDIVREFICWKYENQLKATVVERADKIEMIIVKAEEKL